MYRLSKLENPVAYANIGMGAMGKGILYQSLVNKHIKCVAIADINLNKAVSCANEFNLEYQIVNNLNELNLAIQSGKLAITDKSELLTEGTGYNILFESTSSIAEGANYTLNALQNKKNVILMNSEIDLIFGPYFMQVANENGVCVTSCDGDQHVVLKRMIEEIKDWGFDIVMAGNIKGFLDKYANPEQIKPEADKRNLDYKMCTAYTDGTKLSIEMALVCNNLGYSVDRAGMKGPRAKDVSEVLNLFDFGNIRQKHGTIADYILGAQPGGGVFVVAYQDNPYQSFMMNYYKMGNGPYYLFYRPYHLCHLEIVNSIAEIYLDGFSMMQPKYGFKTNVTAYAKRDLEKGERLDGIGGFAAYGMIENCDESSDNPASGLPICISENSILKRDIRKDERILLEDVADIDPYLNNLFKKSLEVSKKCRK